MAREWVGLVYSSGHIPPQREEAETLDGLFEKLKDHRLLRRVLGRGDRRSKCNPDFPRIRITGPDGEGIVIYPRNIANARRE